MFEIFEFVVYLCVLFWFRDRRIFSFSSCLSCDSGVNSSFTGYNRSIREDAS